MLSSTSSVNSRWYVVKTKPRQESLALQHLQRQSFECFYPRIAVRRKRSGRYTRVIEALFKNYLFINVDVAHHDISPIRSTRGVQGMVKFGSKMVPVPNEIIGTLKSRVDDEQVYIANGDCFQQGQKVTIEIGELAGLEAIFCEPKGEDRALLFINFLGRLQQVEVPMEVVA